MRGQDKPRRGAIYSYLDDNERATAMGILEILLQHAPDIDTRLGFYRSLFPTPLHCAVNSGWLSHAKALVGAGASVYTGPDCSPLCWAKGGSGSSDPVALYLREKLGERGLAMIEDDHARLEQQQRGAGGENKDEVPSNAVEEDVFQLPSKKRRLDLWSIPGDSSYNESFRAAVLDSRVELVMPDFWSTPDDSSYNESSRAAVPDWMAELVTPDFGESSKYRNVLPRPKPHSISINSDGLCQTCAGTTFKELIRPRGYMHWSSSDFLRESARQCELCRIIYSAFNENPKIDPRDDYQVIIRISNGNKGHGGTCTDPAVLRTLEFRLSASCSCRPGDYSQRGVSQDFSKCRGSCEPLAEVLVNIYSQSGE